jgi:thiol peroxidase
MTEITLKGKPIHTSGHLPALHSHAPPFLLVNHDLQDVTLDSFKGKRKLIATVPSLDTSVCSTQTKHLNSFAKKHPHVVILTVSADLPFAQKRFCSHEHVENVITLSMMRDKEFGRAYGILIVDGPLAGILARSIFVLDEKDKIMYMELVGEIAHEPDYHKALHALEKTD